LPPPVNGFWLPQKIQEKIITPDTQYEALSFHLGRPCNPGKRDAVTARWPKLGELHWQDLLIALHQNREHLPLGDELWARFNNALTIIKQRLSDTKDPIHMLALDTIATYTGYSESMIRFTLEALDLLSMENMEAAFQLEPNRKSINNWQPLPGLPGMMQFFPSNTWIRASGGIAGLRSRPLYGSQAVPGFVLGYSAGNVPGAALQIAFLTLAITLTGEQAPVIVIKNSRREPIFSPLVLSALEQVDPDLVSSLALLIWDYEDDATQNLLLSQADLVVAAASDETISQLQVQVLEANKRRRSASPRFHPHGHKVSFSAISKEMLIRGHTIPSSNLGLLNVVTLLSALDSIIWDQHGCLSARIHFVESGCEGHYTALEYASQLHVQLRNLAEILPRGAWPRQQLHDRFDRYKILETTGQVQVLTGYDDEFLVVADQRPSEVIDFRALVNDCQGRVIIVLPVSDLLDVPERYLCTLPPPNLQSISVALGRPGGGLSHRFLRFAKACGERGVTAIRTVGCGAFPQLTHSWDGLIPLDLVRNRPSGRFTTIEFDSPYEQILDSFHQLHQSDTIKQLLLKMG